MNCRRLSFIGSVALVGFLALDPAGCAAGREATDRPNFVVIFTDDK